MNRTANRDSGVLIGSANTQRTRVPSDWILERVHLTSCFDCVSTDCERPATTCKSFVIGQTNGLTKTINVLLLLPFLALVDETKSKYEVNNAETPSLRERLAGDLIERRRHRLS